MSNIIFKNENYKFLVISNQFKSLLIKNNDIVINEILKLHNFDLEHKSNPLMI